MSVSYSKARPDPACPDAMGQHLYERWCRTTSSDTAGYWRMMNPAERRRWVLLAEELAA